MGLVALSLAPRLWSARLTRASSESASFFIDAIKPRIPSFLSTTPRFPINFRSVASAWAAAMRAAVMSGAAAPSECA